MIAVCIVYSKQTGVMKNNKMPESKQKNTAPMQTEHTSTSFPRTPIPGFAEAYMPLFWKIIKNGSPEDKAEALMLMARFAE